MGARSEPQGGRVAQLHCHHEGLQGHNCEVPGQHSGERKAPLGVFQTCLAGQREPGCAKGGRNGPFSAWEEAGDVEAALGDHRDLKSPVI